MPSTKLKTLRGGLLALALCQSCAGTAVAGDRLIDAPYVALGITGVSEPRRRRIHTLAVRSAAAVATLLSRNRPITCGCGRLFNHVDPVVALPKPIRPTGQLAAEISPGRQQRDLERR